MNKVTAYCQNCKASTQHKQDTPNHIMHLIMSILTGFLWVIVWLFRTNKKHPKVCTVCGCEHS